MHEASPITRQQAALELLRRQRAQGSLVEYARSIDIPGAPVNADPESEHFKSVETSLALHHRIMLEAIEATMNTFMGRLMIFAPPGSAKSSYASVVAPSWKLASNDGYRIILASYAAQIAWKQSRKARALCRTSAHTSIWDNSVILAPDQKAVPQWALSNGSEFMAFGITAGITGNRANGILGDDMVAGREAADSEVIREKTWDEYMDSATTRLIPGGWIILIQCMTGDTPVLMADGAERRLDEIRPGDNVASYDRGQLVASRVLNWTSQGVDRCFTIRTSSGITVTANERHPFLVDRAGAREWVRLKDLRPGDNMVRAIGASGVGNSALPRAVGNLRSARDTAIPTTASSDGRQAFARHRTRQSSGATRISSTAMGSGSPSTTRYSSFKAGVARFVENLRGRMSARIGAANFASTTAMTADVSVVCCATTATSLSDTGKRNECCLLLPDTYAITTDPIVEIVPAGEREVFDIQVEATENFIANGLVSHNTRWNEDDVCGRILPEDYAGQSGRILCRDGQYWNVLNIPAKAEHADDPLGRQVGDYLWPEWFPKAHWAQWEHNPRAARTWSALFQQRPTAGEGIEFKREWFKWYDPDAEPGKPGARPTHLTIYGASDFATKEDKSDFTEHGVMGLGESRIKIVIDDRLTEASPIYILDWWYGQKTTDVGISNAVGLIGKHHPRRWWDEGGPIDNAIRPAFTRAMRESTPPVYVDLKSLTSIKNKAVKLASFQARAAAGLVYLPLNRPWATRLLDQLCGFPAAKYDDAADVCGLFGRGIDDMMAPHEPRAQALRQGPKPFTGHWVESNEDEHPVQPRYA